MTRASARQNRAIAEPPPKKYLGDVGAVHSGLGLDEKRLAAYLEGVIKDFRGPVAIEQFDGGQSNPTYRLNTPGGMYVLRRKPPGVLLASAHAVHREYEVMSALFGVGFPVPEPLAMCLDEEVIGSQFYVMRYVPGRVFFDVAMPDLSREERSAVYDSVNATLARLHSLDPAQARIRGLRPTRQLLRTTGVALEPPVRIGASAGHS